MVCPLGEVRSKFQMLGVWYHLTHAKRTPVDTKKFRRMMVVLRRIPKATRQHQIRRKMVRTVANPVMTWAGAWQQPNKKLVDSWVTAVERAVVGSVVPHRSRAAVWIAHLGPWLHPTFMLDYQALALEQ